MPAPALLVTCWLSIAMAFLGMAGLDIPSDPAAGFLGWFWIACGGFTVAAVATYRAGGKVSRTQLGAVLAGAALLRLVAWNVPILLETDIHRYLWDGFAFSRGFNPYEFAPHEVRAAQDEDQAYLYEDGAWARLSALAEAGRDPRILPHLRRVNHPKLPTCYPPVTQLGFAAIASLAPGSEAAWKAFVALVDLLVCGMVLVLLRRLGRPEGWVLFYAWCPVPIKEYANTGHYDPLATLFCLVAVWLLLERRPGRAGAALGVGICAKVYPLVLLPALGRRLGIRGIAAALAVPLLLVAPFFVQIGPRMFDGLLAFAKDWEFNSGIFALLDWGFDRDWIPAYKVAGYLKVAPVGADRLVGDYYQEFVVDGFLLTKLVTSTMLLGLLGLLARWREDADWSVPARAFAAVAGVFLLAPVADPWYLPWLLPYAALFPRASWLYLSASVACYYAYFLEWRYLWWHRPLEYGPFFVLLSCELQAALDVYPEVLMPRAAPAPPTPPEDIPGDPPARR